MSQVIYARVPDSLKQALASRAHERELNLTATVVELLEQGLEASDDQRAERLERALEPFGALVVAGFQALLEQLDDGGGQVELAFVRAARQRLLERVGDPGVDHLTHR